MIGIAICILSFVAMVGGFWLMSRQEQFNIAFWGGLAITIFSVCTLFAGMFAAIMI